MSNSTSDKNNSTFKSPRDSSLILDFKNLDTVLPRLEEVLILEYDFAGKILQLGKECPPELPPRIPFVFADPNNKTADEIADELEAIEMRKIKMSLVAKDQNRYDQQKLQMATRVMMQCSSLLKLYVEKSPTYDAIKNDPLKLKLLLIEIVHLGQSFGFRDHVKQFMVLARANMSDKANLSQFSKRFDTEFSVLLSMLKKLQLDEKSNPTMTIEQYVTKLVAALYIEALPKLFDDIRKDISNENMISVQQPNDLVEAIKLADQYDNIKASSMLATPSHNNKSQSDNLAGAVTNPPKKPPAPPGPGGNKPGRDKKEQPAYTDPNKPPPIPWKNMAYCKHCKRWCSHVVENCKFFPSGDKKDNNPPKKPPAKPGKVGAVTFKDDPDSVWG
jgi:hypothetical protein